MKEPMNWADRCVQAAGYPKGEFTRLVQEAHDAVIEKAVEEWVLLAPLQKVAEKGFKGSSTELLTLLEKQPGVKTRNAKWPKGANQMTREMNEHLDDLEKRGVITQYTKGIDRVWTISKAPTPEPEATTASPRAADLEPLSSKEQTYMLAKFQTRASLADEMWICFLHKGEKGATLYGRSAEQAAQELKRPIEAGRTLRVTTPEFVDLDQKGDILCLNNDEEGMERN